MAEWHFYCGVDPPAKKPKNCRVLRNSGPTRNVWLEPLSISNALVESIPHHLLDLLDIASYVFAADRIASRGGKVGQGLGTYWYRTMRFHLGVRDPEHWSSEELVTALKDLLGFMSEDTFSFEFEHADHALDQPDYFDFTAEGGNTGPVAPVVLFSGGIDSLAGAIEELHNRQDRVVLITHRSSPIMTRCQNSLVGELRRRFRGRILFVPLKTHLSGGLQSSERSQRTRTFLFSAIAGVVASILDAQGIRFYENGVMSVNLPISPQVVGTAATRSTHPRVLSDMSLFLEQVLNKPCTVDNPFDRKTKAEVLQIMAERHASELIAKTISCTEIRRREKDRNHCGACIQCLHRRFGVLSAGLADYDPDELYALDLFISERAPGNDRTMASEFVEAARLFLRLNDEGYLTRFAGELSRLAGALDGDISHDYVRDLLALHRRHGEQVTSVLASAMAHYREKLSRGMLAPGCLLTLAAGRQDALPGAAKPEKEQPPPSKNFDAVHIMLAIDEKNGEFCINDLPVIRTRAGVRVLSVLAAQHIADHVEKRAPTNFRFVAARKIESKLELKADVVARRVERLRNKVDQAFLGHAGHTVQRDLIVQSQSWKGYRLNPSIRVVEMRELQNAKAS